MRKERNSLLYGEMQSETGVALLCEKLALMAVRFRVATGKKNNK